MRGRVAVLVLSLGLAGLAARGRAEWAPDGTHLTAAPQAQVAVALAADGAGGALAAWVDSRDASHTDIYAQRVGAAGTVPSGWHPDGNAVTNAYCGKYLVSMIPDGAGGAILAWSDNRCASSFADHDIYAQHISATGAAATGWPAGGLAVCTAAGNQDQPLIAGDGAGGAFVVWEDWRGGSSALYAQRIAGSGAVAPGWPPDGLPVCPAGSGQSGAAIAPDGAGGVFVAWQDRRSGVGDIYLQRLTGSGLLSPGWPVAGFAACAAPDNQGSAAIATDGGDGVFVAWSDHRGGSDDIYATRVTGAGALAPGWIADGAPVCAAAGDQRKPVVVEDGAGGILVAWQDQRSGSFDVYAQRLDAAGGVPAGWAADGVVVCAAAGDQLVPQIAGDAAGGAYLTWQDARSGAAHIYAQHLTAAGAIAPGWSPDGSALCTAPGTQLSPRIVADGAGGALVAWVDTRADGSTGSDVYALRLLSAGPVQTRAAALAALPHDGQSFLTWSCPAGTGWTYRVYAAPSPILQPSDFAGSTLLAAVGDSSWYDRRLSVLTGQTCAYRIDSLAAALSPAQGLFVATPAAGGTRYYAVTAQLTGYSESQTLASGVNTLATPVAEQLGLPRPVYQRALTITPLVVPDIYTLWTTDHDTPLFPAMANRPGMAFDCAIRRGGAPPFSALNLNFHVREGNFLQCVYPTGGAPGEWVLAPDDPLDTRDEDTFWYGYHADYDLTLWQNPVRTSGEVCDYTLRRTLHTLLWACRTFGLDTTRVYAYGFSMGAIGGMFFAMHYPDRIAALINVAGKVDFSFDHDPNPLSGFNTGNWLRDVADRLWGPLSADLPASQGGTTYEHLSATWLASRLGAVAAPPLQVFSGKNDQAMGWAEKIPFYDAMRDARQGGTFFWDTRDHLNNAAAAWSPMTNPSWLYRFRTNRSFPALSHCSADGDPGDGAAASGDSVGTINGYVEWDTALVDQPRQWKATLRARDLTTRWGPAPAPESLVVDVTPRRLQAFAVVPDSVYPFCVTRLPDSAVVQQGVVVADSLGLLTVPAVKVYRAGSVLRIGDAGDTLQTTAVGEARISIGRPEIALGPNPARAAETVRVTWPRAGAAAVDLFDTGGRLVRRLYRGNGSGVLTLRLEPGALPAGLYFLVASQNGLRTTRRLVVLR